MRKIGLILVALLMTSPSWGQKIKVRKVKGNQAVVDFSGEALQMGQVYELNSGGFADPTSSGTRDHVIGLQASFQSGKYDSVGAKSITTINLVGRYGWNHGNFEFGPMASYTSDNTLGTTTSTMQGGAFGDYNLVPNSAGEVFVYGAGGLAGFGTRDNGSGSSTSLMSFAAGPFVKWFMLSGSFAIRFDGLYEYDKSSGNAADTTYSGFKLMAGISSYF